MNSAPSSAKSNEHPLLNLSLPSSKIFTRQRITSIKINGAELNLMGRNSEHKVPNFAFNFLREAQLSFVILVNVNVMVNLDLYQIYIEKPSLSINFRIVL